MTQPLYKPSEIPHILERLARDADLNDMVATAVELRDAARVAKDEATQH